jgi:hypothetical protein
MFLIPTQGSRLCFDAWSTATTTEHENQCDDNKSSDAQRPQARGWQESFVGGNGERVQERNGKQEFPSELHQLVVSHAWQRGTNPDEHEQEEPNLGEQPNERNVTNVKASNLEVWAAITTKEECRHDRAGGDHVHVFRHLKQCPFDARVFGQVTGDQFLFGLGKIEWRAVRFGETRDDEGQEGDGLKEDHPTVRGLPLHD